MFGPLEFLVLDQDAIGAGKMKRPDNSDTLELRIAMNKDIWNAAIEAAAKILDKQDADVYGSAEIIRELKK